MSVAIIGAGVSGLAAAHTLRKGGAKFIVLEEKNVPGGRIASAWKEGYTLDLGAQLLGKCYDATFQLCREVGLEEEIVPYPFVPAFLKDNKLHPLLVTINPRNLFQYRSLLREFLPSFWAISARDKAHLANLLLNAAKKKRNLRFTDFEKALDLDTENLEHFTLNNGGKGALKYFSQHISTCMAFCRPDQMSALFGLASLWHLLNGCWTLKKGIGTLATRLHKRYRESIRLSTPANRIVIEQGAVKGVEIDGSLLEADAVICATTATTALKLMTNLPDTIRLPMETVRYGPCCHVIFGLRKRLLPKHWYFVPLPGSSKSSIAGFSDNVSKSPHYAPPGASIVHCFTYGHYAREFNEMSDHAVYSRLTKEIQRFIPFMPDTPAFSRICRWREAMCIAPPGMLTAMNIMRREHYRDVKGLFLAGDYLYMPSVESSVKSGIDAAEAVLAG